MMSQKYYWELSNFMNIYSSDIGIPSDLGSKNIIHQQKGSLKTILKTNWSPMLTILGYMEREDSFISVHRCTIVT